MAGWRRIRSSGSGIFARVFCVKTTPMLPPDTKYEDSAVAEAETREKVAEPPLFKVLLHNDDYTTMEFVVWVLESVFNMAEEQAIQVMLKGGFRHLPICVEGALVGLVSLRELLKAQALPLIGTTIAGNSTLTA